MFNTSLNNALTRANKSEVANWGIPDYSAGISANGVYDSLINSFQAPTTGVLVYYCFISSNSNGVYINDDKIANTQGSNTGYGSGMPITLLLNKNDKVYFTGIDSASSAGYGGTFFPLKGVV